MVGAPTPASPRVLQEVCDGAGEVAVVEAKALKLLRGGGVGEEVDVVDAADVVA